MVGELPCCCAYCEFALTSISNQSLDLMKDNKKKKK